MYLLPRWHLLGSRISQHNGSQQCKSRFRFSLSTDEHRDRDPCSFSSSTNVIQLKLLSLIFISLSSTLTLIAVAIANPFGTCILPVNGRPRLCLPSRSPSCRKNQFPTPSLVSVIALSSIPLAAFSTLFEALEALFPEHANVLIRPFPSSKSFNHTGIGCFIRNIG